MSATHFSPMPNPVPPGRSKYNVPVPQPTVHFAIYIIKSTRDRARTFFQSRSEFVSGISSTRRTMTSAVMMAEKTRAAAHPPNTRERASLTPVMSATVTKTLSGTRERAERVARCSFAIMDERSMPVGHSGISLAEKKKFPEDGGRALDGVVHSNTCLEDAECPESMSGVEGGDRGEESDCGEGADQGGELGVEGDG